MEVIASIRTTRTDGCEDHALETRGGVLARVGLARLYASLAPTEVVVELAGLSSHLICLLDDGLHTLIEDIQRGQLGGLIFLQRLGRGEEELVHRTRHDELPVILGDLDVGIVHEEAAHAVAIDSCRPRKLGGVGLCESNYLQPGRTPRGGAAVAEGSLSRQVGICENRAVKHAVQRAKQPRGCQLCAEVASQTLLTVENAWECR